MAIYGPKELNSKGLWQNFHQVARAAGSLEWFGGAAWEPLAVCSLMGTVRAGRCLRHPVC